jgi:hypothetical protein
VVIIALFGCNQGSEKPRSGPFGIVATAAAQAVPPFLKVGEIYIISVNPATNPICCLFKMTIEEIDIKSGWVRAALVQQGGGAPEETWINLSQIVFIRPST